MKHKNDMCLQEGA